MVCPSGVTCELLFADHLQIFAVFIEAILTNHLLVYRAFLISRDVDAYAPLKYPLITESRAWNRS
jgi:hypothetical protein